LDNQESDKNYVVDEFGSSVKYENEKDKKKVKKDGNIEKFLGKKKQGDNIPQIIKIDKDLVKTKKNDIGNLMNQAGEYDDSEKRNNNDRSKKIFNNLNNNKNNLDFDNGEKEYKPEYSKRNIETKNINTDIGLDIDNISPKEKPQIIRRVKMTLEKQNNNNPFNCLSGLERTIYEQEDLSKNALYSNTFSKSNFNRELKETSTEIKNNIFEDRTFNKTKYRLPLEKDNSIKMYWYDAIEESFNNKSNVIFFGKIYEPQSKSFLSISIIIKNTYRTVFILPKSEYENDAQIHKVFEEFDDLRKKRFNYIKEYQCRKVEKNIVLNYLLNLRKLIKF